MSSIGAVGTHIPPVTIPRTQAAAAPPVAKPVADSDGDKDGSKSHQAPPPGTGSTINITA